MKKEEEEERYEIKWRKRGKEKRTKQENIQNNQQTGKKEERWRKKKCVEAKPILSVTDL